MARKLTHEDFVKKVRDKHNDKITVLGKYENSRCKVLCKCNICSHEWTPIPTDVAHGHGCPKCAIEKKRSDKIKTNSQFVKEVRTVNENIATLSPYKRCDEKIVAKCLVCDHEWSVLPSSILSGHGCPKCAKTRLGQSCRKKHEVFVEEIKEIHNEELTVLGEYTRCLDTIHVRCEKCKFEWNPIAGNLKKIHCPSCSYYKGEYELLKYLCLYQFDSEVKTQIKFNNLTGLNGGMLSYDFYLELNGRKILIERQGEFHDKIIPYGKACDVAEEKFKIQQEHDKRKRDYAKTNGYELIEIWYYENYKDKLRDTGICVNENKAEV